MKPFLALYMQVVFSKAIETYAFMPTQGEAMQIRLEAIFFFFFFLIGKEKSHIKRGAKKATQGIQYLYTHHQNGQKRKKTPIWPNKQP